MQLRTAWLPAPRDEERDSGLARGHTHCAVWKVASRMPREVPAAAALPGTRCSNAGEKPSNKKIPQSPVWLNPEVRAGHGKGTGSKAGTDHWKEVALEGSGEADGGSSPSDCQGGVRAWMTKLCPGDGTGMQQRPGLEAVTSASAVQV